MPYLGTGRNQNAPKQKKTRQLLQDEQWIDFDYCQEDHTSSKTPDLNIFELVAEGAFTVQIGDVQQNEPWVGKFYRKRNEP